MDLWSISKFSDFSRAALELFRYQAEVLPPYGEYLSLLGYDRRAIEAVESVEQIPFLPIEIFKRREVYSGAKAPEAIFTSSGDVASRHFVESLAWYEQVAVRSFELSYGDLSEWGIYALLPSYLEREGSSLIYMVDRFVARSNGRGGGFYLYDHTALIEDMRRDPRPKILLGVSYALLDLAESGVVGEPLERTIIMETGGMKGRREELSKAELHRRLCEAFGVERIHSEYGMAELTSQCYSDGKGIFTPPPWFRVAVRDLSDPFDLSLSVDRPLRGGVNIIDLASKHSCAFIETQDLGQILPDGRFLLEGRITGADVRGCNLLIE